MKRTDAPRISRRRALRRLSAAFAGTCWIGARGVPGAETPEAPPPDEAARVPSSEIVQVTREELYHSNIYCEVPYCSRSSRYFIYARTNRSLAPNATEIRRVEVGTWKDERLDVTVSLGGSAITHAGLFYYLRRDGKGDVELVRADIDAGSHEVVYRRKDESWVRSLGTVSPDGRYYAGGVRIGEGWSRFGIVLVDLEKGTEAIIDEDPYILNPHPQFDHGDVPRLMIQHNRGGRFHPDGKLERLVGPEGATLYVLSVPDGKRTTLQVGTPFTTACTGHEAWIGKTGSMLLTVSAGGDYAPEKGNLLSVRPGEPAKVVSRGYRFNHVGVSRCGKLFSCDDWRTPYKLVVGSIETGRSAVVCESGTSPTGDQNTHPHAYLTPDLRWLLFNSNRSGFAHIHAARVPDGLVEEIARPI